MAITYEPISTTTLGSAVTSVTLSSIPATYTDLVLYVAGHQDGTAGYVCGVRFNGDTTSSYSTCEIRSNGTTVSVANTQNNFAERAFFIPDDSVSSLDRGTAILNINNYANTSGYKAFLAESSADQNGQGFVVRTVSTWRKNNAINSITLLANQGGAGNTFGIGTVITLFGILKA